MAALTQDTPRTFAGLFQIVSYPVAGDAVIYTGAMLTKGADGYAKPAQDAAGETIPIGIALEAVDATGLADGAKRVQVRQGAAWIATSGGNALTQADKTAFILDDNTVVKAAGTTNSRPAGEVLEVASGKALVWIAEV